MRARGLIFPEAVTDGGVEGFDEIAARDRLFVDISNFA